MYITKLVKSAKTISILNYILISLLGVLLISLSFSILLTILDFNFIIPPIIFIILITITLAVIITLVLKQILKLLPTTNANIERLILSKRQFLIDSLIEADRKNINILTQKDEETISKSLKKLLKTQIGILLITILLLVGILGIVIKNKNGIEELYNFLFSSPHIEYNDYISSSIPISIKLIPTYKAEFFASAENIYYLTNSNNILNTSFYTSSTNITIFARKYGIIKEIQKLTPKFISELALLNQIVEIYFNNIKLSSYDYIPTIEAVKGSKIILNLEFSHNIKDAITQPNLREVSINLNRNKVTLTIKPTKKFEFDIKVSDIFSRNLNLEGIQILIRTNDIPIVNIKYPEKDLILISKFILEGYGEIVDNDRIINSWMEIEISNSLIGITKKIKTPTNINGISFKYEENFSFVLDSTIYNFLPGDYVKVTIFAKDIYGDIGFDKRTIYLPTFSQIAKMLDKGLQETKEKISKQKENIIESRYEINKRKIDTSKLIERIQSLKELSTNLTELTEAIKNIYEQIDKTKSIKEEFEKLDKISEKLLNILNDKEFKEIVEKLSKREYSPQQLSTKLEDITKALTELEMQVNKIMEFKDILKSISSIREIENKLEELSHKENNNQIDDKIKEFTKSEEFSRMSQEFKSSFLDKVKQIENAIKQKENLSKEISKILKDMDFEIYKEIMRKLSEINKKQKSKLWEVYFNILSSQYLIQKSKKEIDKVALRYPKIAVEILKDKFRDVSTAIKHFRLTLNEFLNDFSLNPELSQVYSEIEYVTRELEKEFNFFTEAISSGISFSISSSTQNIIDKISFILSKLLDLYEKMNEGMNIQQAGVNINDIMETYRQISKALKEMLENGINEKELSEIEKLLEEAIKQAKSLEGKDNISGNAKRIREELEEILNKIKERKLELAYEKAKNTELNLLEYQRGMFERGISEKREAEKPKHYNPPKLAIIPNISDKKISIKDPFIRKKYLEIVNKYRKIINNTNPF
ncbi:MAG: hypothetical protein N2712_01120 [Brevinematales bacterium]|nr:hypothetical protein [Brevinematales bacterium]